MTKLSYGTAIVFAVASLLAGTGCVRRYNADPVMVTDSAYRSTFPPMAAMPGDPLALKANWESSDAACNVVRSSMQREADGLLIQNRVIASIFSLTMAGLSTALAVYSLTTPQPRQDVVGILSLGAGLSSVPTFFFFGGDEREKELRGRMSSLDSRRDDTLNAFNKLQGAAAEFDSATRRLSQTGTKPEDEPNRVALSTVKEASFSDLKAKQNALLTELLRLGAACR